MIVRVMGRGQYEIDESLLARLNELDRGALEALDREDEAELDEHLDRMGALIEAEGTRLPADVVVPSDLLVPPSDLTLEETRKLVSAEGFLPDPVQGRAVNDDSERGPNVSNYTDDGTDGPLGREAGARAGGATRVSPPQFQPQYQPPQQYQPQYQQQYAPPQPYGYGPYAMRPRRQYPIETKPFFLTSEFAVSVLAIAGIAITAASSDAFGAWRAWILITAVVVGYMVSRGIAKSGTRSNSNDPREQLDLFNRNPDHDGS